MRKLKTITLDAKPKALKMRAPASALSRYDAQIRAAKVDSGEIEILGEIGDPYWGGIDAKTVRARLKEIGEAPVLVWLNSPGGDAFEGIAIYNVLREHKAKVTINVLGLAASAASVIAMAGDTVRMGRGASFMIHSAWGVVGGNQQDMREFADILDKLDNAVAELYADRCGLPAGEVLEMMRKETWLFADDAVDMGFADTTFDDEKVSKARASAPNAPALAARAAALAASGERRSSVVQLSANPPGVSGQKPKIQTEKTNVKTIAQQIADFEAKRAASVARRTEIQQNAINSGRSKDEAEKEEFATLSAEIVNIDSELVDLRLMQKDAVNAATAVTQQVGNDPGAASRARGGEGGGNSGIIFSRSNLAPGVRMARYCQAMLRTKGVLSDALAVVQSEKRWMAETPELRDVFMTAVNAGDTTTAGWASELVYAQNLANEFIEFLRPMTIIGKIPNFARVPFNIRVGGLSGSPSAYWVGQGKPIPMSRGTTTSVSLGIAKAAGLVAIDEELARLSTPSAELMVRDELARAIVQFLDLQFIDPNNGGQTNISPASMTYGVTPTTPSGTTYAAMRTDLQAMMETPIDAYLNLAESVWIMSASLALKLSMMVNALDQKVNPELSVTGGRFQGLPVVVSQAAQIAGSPQYNDILILLHPQQVFLADEGQIAVSVSQETAIQMDDAPTNQSTATSTGTTVVSMFQTNSMAIKAVRFINWTKKRSTAAQWITAANYTG